TRDSTDERPDAEGDGSDHEPEDELPRAGVPGVPAREQRDDAAEDEQAEPREDRAQDDACSAAGEEEREYGQERPKAEQDERGERGRPGRPKLLRDDAQLLAREDAERRVAVRHDARGQLVRLLLSQAFRLIDQREFFLLRLWHAFELLALGGNLRLGRLP